MATPITAPEREKLFKNIYNQLGYGVREVEITDDQMDTLFCNAVEDYSRFINEWLIDQQWSTVSGLSIEDADFDVAFSTKDLSFVKSFTYAYSRQVGLGTNAPAGDSWELKKDFVILSANTQFYSIPKGREVNEVMWVTPSFMAYDTLNPVGWSAYEFGWGYGGTMFGYVQPAYSSLLAASDRSMKNRIMKGELSYRITGKADGSKILHLYNVPGGRYTPKGLGSYFDSNVNGMQVWYFYYETNNKNKSKCLSQNSDIAVVTRPSDVPLDNLKWGNLNASAKTWIRKYLLATAKVLLGHIRGKYSGNLDITDASIQMDYGFLLEEGNAEIEKLETQVKERLDGLTYENQLAKRANEAEQLNKILGYSPLGIYIH
jgi:hypothetical protein